MIPEQDFERLSAYLDDELSPAEKARLEARLAGDADLLVALTDLRRQARALRGLPPLKPPRNFTLTAAQARAVRRPRSPFFESLFPALRLATSLSAAAFALVLAAAVMTPAQPQAATSFQAAAPVPKEASPLAETGGAGQAEGPAAALAPADTPLPEGTAVPEAMLSAAAEAPTEPGGMAVESYGTGAEPPAADASRQAETPAANQVFLPGVSAAPDAVPAPAGQEIPLSAWAWGLGALTALLAAGWAALTWFLHRR